LGDMNILITGGSGKLGQELKKISHDADFPESGEFNIVDYEGMLKWIEKRGKKYNTLIHCAAFTSPPEIDKDPIRALQVNIIGSANIVKLCEKNHIRLVYISTDYVFDGQRGCYKEEDALNPVNRYAISKLGGECAVRLYENSLIIRLSFGPNSFPYEAAFTDQWTSREAVSVSARKILKLAEMNLNGIIHIGSERRTVYKYAHSLEGTKEIKGISIKDVNFRIPQDTSLNTDKYNALVGNRKEEK
jgi:dTDP-4-dehydrorhamnose reductase